MRVRSVVIVHMQERVKAFKKEMGSAVLGEVTVDQALGGMRGIPVRVCDGFVPSCLLTLSAATLTGVHAQIITRRGSFGRHPFWMQTKVFGSEVTRFLSYKILYQRPKREVSHCRKGFSGCSSLGTYLPRSRHRVSRIC